MAARGEGRQRLLVVLTAHISLLVRTAAVLKGSTASASTTAAAAAAAASFPLALPVAVRRATAMVAAGALVVGH
jgi:hypothetical protein